jgi:Transposase DDE domain group 1
MALRQDEDLRRLFAEPETEPETESCTTECRSAAPDARPFLANTFRVLLTAAAYVLMQVMRLHLAPTHHARAQVSTLREHFLKIGVQLIITVRRIVLHMPQAFPYRDSFLVSL